MRVYRRLEMRGEIRGGRFVAGVAGEQFALSDAVERLRQLREEPAEQSWQVISAADPINLVGIITRDARVPATRANRVLFLNGRPIAASESRSIRWIVDVDDAARQRATRLLLGPDTWRRQQLAVEFAESSDGDGSRPNRPQFDSPGRSPGTKAQTGGEAL